MPDGIEALLKRASLSSEKEGGGGFLPTRTIFAWTSLVGLLVLHLWANLSWVWRNVTPLGRDAGGHLNRSLAFYDVLQPWSTANLLQALTLTPYRPPLLYILVQPFYRLFGLKMDAAQYVNVVLLLAILVVTFLLGRRMFGERTALLAIVLLGFFPMMAAMTRLFYVENLQTFFVIFILWALYRTEQFRARAWSVVWGVGVGLGMLAKWTVGPLVALPIVWQATSAGVWRATWHMVRHVRPAWPRLIRGLVLGGLVVGLTFGPHYDLVSSLPLGLWLYVMWTLLWAAAAVALWGAKGPRDHFWGALFVAGGLASIWYLGRVDFLPRLLEAAFGSYGGNYDTFNPFRLRNYTRYPTYLITAHLGVLPALLVLPPVAWAWWRWRSHIGGDPIGVRLLWLTVLSTYLALSLPSQDGERNLVPLLPVIALLCAAALRGMPRRAATLLASLWVSVLGLQWGLFTFDLWPSFQARTSDLWVQVEFVQPPARGLTDPKYWIAPDVLSTVADNSPPDEQVVFGMLINSPEIHRGPYRYLIRTRYPNIHLLALTEDHGEGWRGTARSAWLLTKNGDNHDVEPAGLRALREVYENRDGIFPLLFEPVKRYPLPGGETATLWRRVVGPRLIVPPAIPPEEARRGALLSAWLGDSPLLVANREEALWLAVSLDLAPERVVLPEHGPPPTPTLFTWLPPDTERSIPWLQDTFVPAFDTWLAGRLWMIWARADMLPAHAATRLVVDDRLSLTGMAVPSRALRGQAFPVRLTWSGERPGLKISLRLMGPEGNVVAQLDRELRTTMEVGLFVPPETPADTYTLALVVYEAATGQPLGRTTSPTVLTEVIVEQE